MKSSNYGTELPPQPVRHREKRVTDIFAHSEETSPVRTQDTNELPRLNYQSLSSSANKGEKLDDKEFRRAFLEMVQAISHKVKGQTNDIDSRVVSEAAKWWIVEQRSRVYSEAVIRAIEKRLRHDGLLDQLVEQVQSRLKIK